MQPNREPLVSVVVITYNSSSFVIETLESIKAQSYDNIELIIADDCSSDDTIQICKVWLHQNGSRFKRTEVVEAHKNVGIAGNCNRGVQASKGEWFKIIAGDDALLPDVIAEYIKFINGNASIAAVFSNIEAYKDVFKPEHRIQIQSISNLKFNSENSSAYDQFQILLRTNCVNAPTVMLKKSIVEQLGGFDERFPFLEDWPIWLSLTKAGYKMHYINMIGVKYRLHSHSIQGLSNKNTFKSKVELEVDKLFLKDYIQYLPFIERQAKLIMLYRNLLLIKLFGNKSNVYILQLSKAIGFIPSIALKKYKKKFLY